VVKTLNGDKPSSPHGFSLGFFQRFREVLKKDSIAVFKEYHGKGRFKKNINAMFISLIPKRAGVVVIKDIRPISSVGGVYKIISKVLVNRLKQVLEKIISNSQNAFIFLEVIKISLKA
jgi:hypothetical protein